MNRSLLLVATTAVVWAPSSEARADTCLPDAFGVPRTGGAPPSWTDDTSATAIPEDDPGWTGATEAGHGDGVDFGRVRIIRKSTSDVFLSIDTIPLNSTRHGEIWLGFSDGANHRVFEIRISNPSLVPFARQIPCHDSSNPACVINQGFSYRIWAGSSFPLQVDNTMTVDSATWFSSSAWVWNRAGNMAVFLKIPLANLGLTTTAPGFKYWYEFNVIDSAQGTIIGESWPDAAPDAQTNLAGLFTPTNADYDVLRLDTTASACRPGYFVDRSNVGVARSSGGATLTNQIVGKVGPDDGENWFIARPEHSVTGAPPTGGIQGRFRIADWGSSGPGVWNPPPGAPPWIDLNASGAVEFGSWTLSAAERCEYGIPAPGQTCPAATKDDHQCVLFELRTTDPNVVLTASSVFRNTNFVNLSNFSRQATIGAQGLPAGAGSEIIYYLFVERLHMPSDYGRRVVDPAVEVRARLEAIKNAIKADYSPPPDVVRRLEALAARGDQQAADELKRLREEARKAIPPRVKKTLEGVTAALSSNDPMVAVTGLGTDVIERVMPSMLVHVFHDSGHAVTRTDGSGGVKSLKVFERQSGFGYHARHKGGIAGWGAVIDGAEVLGGGWYRLRIPANGKRAINTRIQAAGVDQKRIEPNPRWRPQTTGGGRPCQGCCCKRGAASVAATIEEGVSHGLFAAVVLLIAVVVMRRRR